MPRSTLYRLTAKIEVLMINFFFFSKLSFWCFFLLRLLPLHAPYDRIVVTGFAKSKDGSPGPAQACEKIKAMDIIVGCNGVDLTELTFNECMSVIRHADWPKTLHFIRDPSTANAVPVIKEGWTKFGVAGAGNAHRRRYLEVKEGDIFYFKPTPGGAISKDPDGNVQLVMVETFSKIMDRTTTEDEQFQIKILFKDASKLPVVIACASAEDMDEWADALPVRGRALLVERRSPRVVPL